jgi:hypothetical protein
MQPRAANETLSGGQRADWIKLILIHFSHKDAA